MHFSFCKLNLKKKDAELQINPGQEPKSVELKPVVRSSVCELQLHSHHLLCYLGELLKPTKLQFP